MKRKRKFTLKMNKQKIQNKKNKWHIEKPIQFQFRKIKKKIEKKESSCSGVTN